MGIFKKELFKKIREYIDKEKITTASEISRNCDCERITAKRHLTKLKENNIVTELKKGNQVLYIKK